jgi:tetratricopeptide (TPR) repeat protein
VEGGGVIAALLVLLAAAPAPATGKASPLATMLGQGKHREGLEWLRSFGGRTPAEERYRGLFHHGLGEPDPALAALVPAYRANPKDDVVALALAEASLWKKDYKTAVTVVGQLAAPDAPEALRVRGMVFEQAGRFDEALALYTRAIPRLSAPHATIERKAQVLSWQKRFDESAALYQQVVASPQASLTLRRRCRVRLAELSAWRKDLDGALGQLRKLLDEEPRLGEALLLEGQILEWKGDYPGAKRSYSRVLAGGPTDPGRDPSQAEARLRLNKLLWVH